MYVRILLLCLLNTFFVNSQSATLFWQKCYGGTSTDFADKIKSTPDGGFIQVGNVASNNGNVSGNHGDSDAWVVKCDVVGNIQWQKCLGGSVGDYKPRLTLSSDGGYLVVFGSESVDGTLNVNYGSVDICAVKMGSSGNIEWINTYGGSGTESTGSVLQLSDGSYVISGSTESNDGNVTGNHGGIDGWIFKVNAFGQIIWKYCYGGTNNDIIRNMVQTSDGGFIFIGNTKSNTGIFSSNHGLSDYWIVKLTSSGTIVWQKCLGGSNDEDGYSIKQTSDNGYILNGWTQSNNGNVNGNHSSFADYWVLKLDLLGNIVWQKCYGGTMQDFGYDIEIESNNSYLIGGTSQSTNGDVIINHGGYDYWIARIDTVGNLINQYSFGGSLGDDFKNMDKTIDDNYLLFGNSQSNNINVSGNHGQSDLWVVKFCFPKVNHINETASDSILINGINYTSSGIYYDTISNANSCDSILILNLTITHLGFEENNIENICVFPNPANEYVHVIVKNQGVNTEYSITDLNGKVVSCNHFETKEYSIPVSFLSKGIYTLKVNNFFKRIIIN